LGERGKERRIFNPLSAHLRMGGGERGGEEGGRATFPERGGGVPGNVLLVFLIGGRGIAEGGEGSRKGGGKVG